MWNFKKEILHWIEQKKIQAVLGTSSVRTIMVRNYCSTNLAGFGSKVRVTTGSQIAIFRRPFLAVSSGYKGRAGLSKTLYNYSVMNNEINNTGHQKKWHALWCMFFNYFWVADSEFDIHFFRLGQKFTVLPVWRFFGPKITISNFFRKFENFWNFLFCNWKEN